jgi:TetR/AcrR family transcriptional regulator
MSLNRNTESAIIDAARKVFIIKGYSGTTLGEIAAVAEVNKASLHYYYRSKDKLFEIVLNEACGIIHEKLILIFKSEDTLEVIVNDVIDVYVETFINQPYLPNFIINEFSNNPEKVSKILLGDKLSTFTVLRMIVMIRNKISPGNKEVVNLFDLILNVVSLNVFPFLIRPIITHLFKIKDEQFNSFVINRKSNLASFILKALTQ